ncbi:cytochrome b [Methylobacillus arboreus]|uniref:cytochrome b n=1 Tax=Methylobacillus arboreus TaxID=755170 RepID=UPI001E5851DB|nr:cytochrome b [Methylobacillus arboreus]MCB5190504.1 cytochrome b [Methylobacillus arboreus]
MNNPVRYTKVAIALHWLVGIGILFLLALGWYMNELPKGGDKVASFDLFDLGLYTVHLAEAASPRTFYFNLHKSIGFTVFLLVGLRLYWRLMHQPPALSQSLKRWEKVLAHGTHHLLYLMMVLMPATGLLTTLYSKYGLHWFAVPVLPGLDEPGLRDFFVAAHEISAIVLTVLIGLHVAAALKHQFIDKDGIMKRMSFF